jgi:hypothetical protein
LFGASYAADTFVWLELIKQIIINNRITTCKAY